MPTPKEDPYNEQRKIQMQFDEIPLSVGVVALMAVASVFVLPAVYVLEQLDIIKKKRIEEKECPSCKKEFPSIDTLCFKCKTKLVDK
jgi:hypothetical protein